MLYAGDRDHTPSNIMESKSAHGYGAPAPAKEKKILGVRAKRFWTVTLLAAAILIGLGVGVGVGVTRKYALSETQSACDEISDSKLVEEKQMKRQTETLPRQSSSL